MSLSKLKKAELIALAEANDIEVESGATKDDIIEVLEDEGITESGNGNSFDVIAAIENDELVSREDNPLPASETKVQRQARLKTRHKPKQSKAADNRE